MTTDSIKRLLVVDDEQDIREFLEMYFSNEWEVRTAVDGSDALSILQSAANDGVGINVVVTDYDMSKMNGLQLFTKYNLFEETRKLRMGAAYDGRAAFCLATTDENFEGILAEAKKLGFAGVISKPFQNVELSQLVTAAFAKYESQRGK